MRALHHTLTMHFSFFFSVIFFTTGLIAQSENDTIIGFDHLQKGEYLLKNREFDSAYTYFEKAIPIYKKTMDWKKVVGCYNRLAEIQLSNSKDSISLELAQKAFELSIKHIPNSVQLVDAYHNLGAYYLLKPNFEKALFQFQNALSILQNYLPDNRQKLAFTYDQLGKVNREIGKYPIAIKNYEKSISLKKNIYGDNHIIVADGYDILGDQYRYSGNFDDAQKVYNNALSIKLKSYKNENHKSIGKSYYNLGSNYYAKGEIKEALSSITKSLKILNTQPNKNQLILAKCYKLHGDISFVNTDFHDAIKYYQKSFEINKIIKAGEKQFFAIDHYLNISNILFQQGKLEDALVLSKKSLALAITLEGKDHVNQFANYASLGSILGTKGEYKKGAASLKKAISLQKKRIQKENMNTAFLYLNLGVCYKYQEHYTEALEYYEKAISIFESNKNSLYGRIAGCYNNIANIYSLKNDYINALIFHRKALDLLLAYDNKKYLDLGYTYREIGLTYENQKKLKEALTYYNKSLEVLLKSDEENSEKLTTSYITIANYYWRQMRYEKALEYINKAKASNRIPNISKENNDFSIKNYFFKQELFRTLLLESKVYISQYQHTNKTNYLYKSETTLRHLETLIVYQKQHLTDYSDKVTFSKQIKEVYRLAIQNQIFLSQNDEGKIFIPNTFLFAEKSKANTLEEILNDSNAKQFAKLPSEIITLESNLKTDKAFYESQITKEHSKHVSDSSKIATHENKLFDISRSQDSLAQIIEKNYPKYHQLKYNESVISATAIQQKLADQTTLLEFFTTDSITYVFTVSKNKLHVKELNTPDLETTINSFKEAITSKNNIDYKQFGHRLYALLIEPVAEDLVGNKLIIVPDGPLWHLNFDLLLTEDTASNNPKEFPYLLKDFAISYANSANLLFNSFTTPKSKNQKLQECLAFSFSDSTNVVDSKEMSLATLRDAGDDLPGTRAEIKAISDIVDGQYFYGSEAVESNFKKNASNYNILHLALHGEVDNERPENSKLYFTKSKDTLEDNFLYSHELFALDIPAELTVLSACNTGTGKIAKGEGIMSLGNAFQYAGTKSLLLSSWEVSDQTTPELMQNFYRNLKKGMNKSKALQQAKLQYLQNSDPQRSAPFYWGGFYLVGDASPMTFSSPGYWYWIVIGIILLITIFIFLFKRKTIVV